MTTTDRSWAKEQAAGTISGLSPTYVVNPVTVVSDMESRTRDVVKTGSENAATNAAETPAFVVARKSQLKNAYLVPLANVANSNTDFTVITLSKRTAAGGSQTTVATWNSSTTGQGAAGTSVALASQAFAVVPNADAVIAAGSVVTYTITKTGAGQLITQYSTIHVDLEEV